MAQTLLGTPISRDVQLPAGRSHGGSPSLSKWTHCLPQKQTAVPRSHLSLPYPRPEGPGNISPRHRLSHLSALPRLCLLVYLLPCPFSSCPLLTWMTPRAYDFFSLPIRYPYLDERFNWPHSLTDKAPVMSLFSNTGLAPRCRPHVV